MDRFWSGRNWLGVMVTLVGAGGKTGGTGGGNPAFSAAGFWRAPEVVGLVLVAFV